MTTSKNESVITNISVDIISHNLPKILLNDVHMVLLPSMDLGVIGVLIGHQKTIVVLESGTIKCLAGDGSVLYTYNIDRGIARIDSDKCSILAHKIQKIEC